MNTKYEYMDETSIDPDLICSICHSPFIDPCYAPCGETFCRECITKWIQTEKSSCPHCRRDLSITCLIEVPRYMRSILDRLQVKCTLCGQNELERANFDKHIEKVCPKIIVSCRAADIKCLWTGQREQLDQHLTTCHFEPMRPAITEMMGEIQQLTDLVDQKIIQITRQQEEIGQLQQQLRFQIAQNSKRQNENQQLRAQMIQLKTQVNTHRRASQQYYEPLKQGDTQTASMSRIQSLPCAAMIQTGLMASSGVEGFKGTWDYVDAENFDAYMKEIGVGLATRMLAKGLKPRIIISEDNGKWTIRSETTLKTVVVDFTPGVEFNETTPDGREVTSTINFEGDKWIHTSVDKNGKKSVVIRYIDSNGQLMIEMECNSVKARRWYQRTE